MKFRILLIIMAFSFSGLKAQEADRQIADLLNSEDWFALEEMYSKEKENIKTPMLRVLSETLIAYHFNQPKSALLLIDSLLSNYQDVLGFTTTCNMVALKGAILGEEGLYAQSADEMNDFLGQVTAFAKKEDFPSHVSIAKRNDEMRDMPKIEISRPQKDTKIPMYIEKAGKGKLMFIPVRVNGKEYRFIFDTGAGGTFVSERFAKEVGLRIIKDSIMITGVESAMGKSGTIDSLIIGDIVFKNPIITIAPPNVAVDTIYQVDAVLGLDFIRRVGETQIFPSKGEICFPYKQTSLPSTGKNMVIQNGQPHLKTYSAGERLIFHFDSGNATGDLYDTYYQKHKDFVNATGTKARIEGRGFGGIRIVDGFKMPEFGLQIGSVDFKLHNVSVSTASVGQHQQKEDGSLGMDFITTLKKVTLNFDKMFVEVEK